MSVTPYTKVSSASLAGLITDGNALMVTEQSNLDEANYEILRDGTRRRRRPIIQETEGAGTFLGSSKGSLRSSYLWQTPAFRDNFSILCEENNGEVRFYQVDHDTPSFIRGPEISQDRLKLELWGNRSTSYTSTITAPCTYTEGNGSLYIFNPRSGTIRVELLNDNRLRMSAIGTWVRDYRGASEEEELDYRTTSLTDERSYNLSNSGWDSKSVQAFQSAAGKYPATTDKYLAGRRTDEAGVDTFSFDQLEKAKDNKSMPPMGSRINASEFGPAGTLVSIPTDMASSTTISQAQSGRLTTFNVTTSSEYAGISDTRPKAAFVHCLSFTVVKDGRTYQGGVSGMFESAFVGSGNIFGFTLINDNLAGYTSFQLKSLYLHPSPAYFPHMIEDNGNGYNYRRGGRRPLAGAFYAGRLWQTADNHNRLYYSQIVDTSTGDSEKRGVNLEAMCFAAADPTDGDDNSVVGSDGGYINSNDSGTHYGLIPLGDSLLLLTDRGVWAVRPGSGGTFSASDYQFVKVVGAEVLGPQSFISTGDQVHVATDEGILALSMQSTSFGNTTVQVERMLDRRIMKGYEDIVSQWPNPAGVYEPESRTVRWLFRPTTDYDWGTEGQPMLSYSLYHDAWYKYVLGADSRVFDMQVLPYTAKTGSYNKFRYLIGGESAVGSNVYLTGWGVEVDLGPYGFGEWIDGGLRPLEPFADYRPLAYEGNSTRDPVPAYMLTNHMVPGEGIKWSQILYIIVYNRNVNTAFLEYEGNMFEGVEGGTLLSIRWDWMSKPGTGKWTNPYQTYRYRKPYFPTSGTGLQTSGEPVIAHKMKLRGRGREFRLYFESDGHKDSHLEGWAYQGYILDGA